MNIKIRCSSLGSIMAGTKRVGLTEKQAETLNNLLTKIKLTEKQAELRDELIAKRDAKPTLSAGAKTTVEKIVRAQYLGYSNAQLFSSKETEKGNLVEQSAIDYISDFYINEFEKNLMYFENDYITGNPDIYKERSIIDIKCPWSKATMPLTLEEGQNDDYEWQVRGYMWLTDSDVASIQYVLMNTPEELCKYEDPLLHNVDDLPPHKRLLSILYFRDKEKEELIKNQVILCQEYAKEYLDKIITNSTSML